MSIRHKTWINPHGLARLSLNHGAIYRKKVVKYTNPYQFTLDF